MPLTRSLALLVNALDLGGTERQVLLLLEGLGRAGWSPTLLCLNRRGSLLAEAEGLGVDILDLAWGDAAFRPGHLGTLGRLGRSLEERGIALVHSWLFRPNLAAAVLKSFFPRLRVVAAVRGSPGALKGWQRAASLLVFRMADAVTVNSRNLADGGEGWGSPPPGKAVLIPNGIRLPATAPGREGPVRGPVTVGMVGRFVPEKRQEDLVRALAVVRRGGLDVGVLFVGEGETLPRVRATARALGVEGACRFAGTLDGRALLRDLEVLAHVSSHEGMPNAVMEAMAAGLPVVATRVGGVPDLVEEGESGFLVEPGDIQGLARRLGELAGDPSLRRRMGDRGRESIGGFSVERMVERHLVLYEGLAGRGK